MGKIKAWQIIVIVLGVAALGFRAFMTLASGGADSQLAYRLYGVDVVTGEVFYFEVGGRKGGVVWPAVNPETGTTSILPAYPSEDNEQVWIVPEHYRAAIGSTTPESDLIDQAGRVEVADTSPKSGR